MEFYSWYLIYNGNLIILYLVQVLEFKWSNCTKAHRPMDIYMKEKFNIPTIQYPLTNNLDLPDSSSSEDSCKTVSILQHGYSTIDILTLIKQVNVFHYMGSFKLFFFHQVDNLPNTWPTWVNNLTFFSHLLLAINASVNLLLYCFCDKHFWVITQKTLKVNINSTKENIFEVDS